MLIVVQYVLIMKTAIALVESERRTKEQAAAAGVHGKLAANYSSEFLQCVIRDSIGFLEVPNLKQGK